MKLTRQLAFGFLFGTVNCQLAVQLPVRGFGLLASARVYNASTSSLTICQIAPICEAQWRLR